MTELRLSMLIALFAAAASAQSTAPVVLEVDVDNAVQYRSDIADPAKRGTDINITTAATLRAFTDILIVGDIVAVNGKPARGLWTSRQFVMNFNPNPAAGFAVADVNRGTIADCKWEFLDAEGRFVGALADSGLAPHAVVGGSGAFFGARGQMAGGTSPNPKPIRIASMSEDPANRRILGGGTSRIVFHLIPHFRPAILALFHEADFSPVTESSPVHPGETLIIQASGLGPVVPGTTPPGMQPFPEKLVEVNSPVAVTINGQAAEVVVKVGWPTQTDAYRVDVKVPAGITPGTAVVVVTAGWVPGIPFPVQVR